MTKRQVIVVAVAIACIVGIALPAVSAAQSSTPGAETSPTASAATDLTANETADGSTDASANESANESAAFGNQLTAFMQSSAGQTNDTVESGMWSAGFENANESEQARMAQERTATHEQRLERLQQRNETLTERYENGSIPPNAYLAQSSRLSGQIAALQTSINDTERVASDAGVDETRLETLRNEARNMTGPEVAGVARGVVAGGQGPPHDRANGPPHAQGSGPPGANGPPGPNGDTVVSPHDETDEEPLGQNGGNETSSGSTNESTDQRPGTDDDGEESGQGNNNPASGNDSSQ